MADSSGSSSTTAAAGYADVPQCVRHRPDDARIGAVASVANSVARPEAPRGIAGPFTQPPGHASTSTNSLRGNFSGWRLNSAGSKSSNIRRKSSRPDTETYRTSVLPSRSVSFMPPSTE